MLPSVHRGCVPERDVAEFDPGYPEDELGAYDLDVEGDGDQRFAQFRFHGRPARPDHAHRARVSLCSVRARRRGPPYASGAQDGGFPDGAAVGEDADRVGGTGVFGGDLVDRGHAVRAERLLPSQGETGPSGFEEGEVPSAGGGPFDVVDGVQWVEGEQFFEPVVL